MDSRGEIECSSVARSHGDLIDGERERRKEAVERELRHIDEIARQLGKLTLAGELTIDELTGRLKALVNRKDELRASAAINEGTSWVAEFLCRIEAKEMARTNPALREFLIQALATEEVEPRDDAETPAESSGPGSASLMPPHVFDQMYLDERGDEPT